MSDIFGRSTITPTDGITRRQITSMIKRYVASGLNLVDVDPGEIVVFGDKQGKLKTSDISLDSLLIKNPTAKDDSIVVFKSGKLEPSYDIKRFSDKFDTIDAINVNTTNAVKNLAILQSAYDSHVVSFTQLRRNFNTADNTIEKFFGKKNIKPDEVTTTLPDLKKSIEDSASAIKDITAINSRLDLTIDAINVISSRLGVIRDTETISNLIDEVRKSIEDSASVIKDIKTITDKVKIPHEASIIKGLSYVVHQALDLEYSPTGGSNIVKIRISSTINKVPAGIYRLSIISEHQFNIAIRNHKNLSIIQSKGVNVVLFKSENEIWNFEITSVDANVVRAKFGYIIEYVSSI